MGVGGTDGKQNYTDTSEHITLSHLAAAAAAVLSLSPLYHYRFMCKRRYETSFEFLRLKY